jgi:hypothetical protein
MRVGVISVLVLSTAQSVVACLRCWQLYDCNGTCWEQDYHVHYAGSCAVDLCTGLPPAVAAVLGQSIAVLLLLPLQCWIK